jgi:phosphoribosyl-ATP pyrophosphohydrolase/phosphoribosyl-AMP cyclohydrolase
MAADSKARLVADHSRVIAFSERFDNFAARRIPVQFFQARMADTFVHNVRFDERGSIAAVVQDSVTSEVIAVRFIDKETLAKSLRTGEADSFIEDESSRRGKYSLLDVRVNRDGESLTVLVQHSGEFEQKKAGEASERTPAAKIVPSEVSLVNVSSMEFGLTIHDLYALIADRKEKLPEGSYTTYLFESGLDKILKKVAEESGEVIIAAKNKASREIVSELADLFYHLLVLMVERDVKLSDVGDELTQRAGKRNAGNTES